MSFSIEYVRLRVSDVERSAEFYAALTGMRIAETGVDRARLADPAAGAATRLELIKAEAPGRAPDAAAGLYHVAYLYPGRGGLGAALKRIANGGYDFIGASDHGVSEALYLQDPDNLGIELYWDRPRAKWPMDGERIAMFTAPLALAPLAAEAIEGDPEQTAEGIGIGHVHLRAASLDDSRSFWLEEVGLEVMAELPGALFMATGGYHHHIGANVWQSAGSDRAPAEGPGLDAITLSRDGEPARFETPEGVQVSII